jgi:Neuraminidase (sialidase)
MNLIVQSHPGKVRLLLLISLLVLTVSLLFLTPANAQFQNVKIISVDKFTDADTQHRSEVEPDTFSWGNTIVSTFHVGRRPPPGWGSAGIGFSTSTDAGKTWTYGYLPGLTVNYKGGTYYGAADPSVAYDAKHGVWMISTLPLIDPIGDVAVSLSRDGLHWSNPVLIDTTHDDDKNWTVCDNTPSSPYYGNCYTEWDAALSTGWVLMSVSSDGGKTWSAGKPTADHATGLGGQPLVQPNGTVVVPFEGFGISTFSSTDGGQSWSASKTVAAIDSHGDAGIRNPNLPSAEIDASGKIYVVWSDCRFRTNCAENDIVMSTSTDGNTWSQPARIPIDPISSTVDHFIPGIGVDHSTSGNTAHLTLLYYYYPVSNCSTQTCQLDVGFVTSDDGGATWTAGKQIAGPVQLAWLPNSDLGPMVADYVSVSYANGKPWGVFAVAKAPSGGLLQDTMVTTKQALLSSPGEPRFSSANDKPIPGAKSDHEMKFYLDDEHRFENRRSSTSPEPEKK